MARRGGRYKGNPEMHGEVLWQPGEERHGFSVFASCGLQRKLDGRFLCASQASRILPIKEKGTQARSLLFRRGRWALRP